MLRIEDRLFFIFAFFMASVVAFSKDGDLIASCTQEGLIRMWD